MENNNEDADKNKENKDSGNNKVLNDIELFEKIKSLFKDNQNCEKRKSFHQKSTSLKNNNVHQSYPTDFINQNTMEKNRAKSVKYNNNSKYGNQIHNKNSNNDAKIKNYNNYGEKKREQEINDNNKCNNSLIDDYMKINFVNKNKEEENIYNDQKIEELLKIGKCFTGVIRMNKSQNHGYITVPELKNDILIRGRNLYQCLNLDEVVVELFNFSQWKPFATKKTKKFSHVNEDHINNVSPKEENKNLNTIISQEEENNLKTKEEKLMFINEKLYNFRPEGRIVKIIKSPNNEKQQKCTIQIENNKILAVPIDDTIPEILINIRNLTKEIIPNIENMNKTNYFPNDFERDYSNYKENYFLVKIYSYSSSNIHKGPLGYIINEIGPYRNIDMEKEILSKYKLI